MKLAQMEQLKKRSGLQWCTVKETYRQDISSKIVRINRLVERRPVGFHAEHDQIVKAMDRRRRVTNLFTRYARLLDIY